MSLNFTQITNLIDRNCKSNAIAYTLADKAEDINIALDFIYSSIFQSSGTWQFDDSNHIDYPIITTNLVSGQRDYSFTTDEQGNMILDIYKVLVKDENGIYQEIQAVDVQSESESGFTNGLDLTGTPSKYDKTANGIFLDKIPSYNSTGGLKIYINREGSYFLSTDTTKKPGFAAIFHEYLALRPSYMYAYRNGLPNVALLRDEMMNMEKKITKFYSLRSRDERPRLRVKQESNR